MKDASINLTRPRFKFLETDGHELPRLQGGVDPLAGRVQVALTVLAEVNGHLFWNALRDINLSAETGHAHVGGVGVDGRPALAAQDLALDLLKVRGR